MDRFVHSLVDDLARGRATTCCSSRATTTTRSPAYDDLLRSTAVDAFVVTDTYLGNPQAAWLDEQRAPFVAFGRPWDDPDARHPWVDVDGAAGADLATDHLIERGHTPHRLDRLAQGLAASARTAAPAGHERCARAASPPPGSPPGSRTPSPVRPRGQRGAARRGRSPTAFVCASDTLAMGVLHTLCRPRPRRRPATSRSSASTTPRSPRSCRPGLTSVRQPLEEVAVEVVKRAQGCSATRRSPAGRAAHPEPRGPRQLGR